MKKTVIPFPCKPKSRRPSPRLVLEHLETRLAPANVDVLSYHYDGLLSGNDNQETILTPATVNATNFGLLFTQPVDGQVYATPLYKANLAIPGQGTHNVAFLATEHDSVYAFDADTGAQLWQRSFINPAAGVTPIPSGDTSGNVFPEYGITGTPAIDPATNTMYVVAQTKEVVGGTAHYVDRLHAINITTGADRATNAVVTIGDTTDGGPDGGFTDNTSIVVNGTGAGTDGTRVKFNAHWELQRPGLTLVGGNVFIAFAGFNDQNVYHGWVVGYHASDLSLQGFICLSPNARAAGIWQSGGALATDGTSLYFATGNTFSGPKPGFSPADNNYGETVVKLTPTGSALPVSDYFTPYNWAALDGGDLDIGSGGTMLLPDSVGSAAHRHLMVETGKTGRLYLIDRDDMGKNDTPRMMDHVVQILELGGPGIWGNPSFVQTGPNSGLIFYHGSQAVMKAITIANGVLSFSTTNPATSTTLVFGYPGGQPVISSNGTATPIAWDLQVDGNTEILRAYNALNLAQELYNSNASSLRDQGGGSVKFIAPTVTNGHVLVGGAGTFSVYGLFPTNTAAPAPVTNVAGTGLAGGSQIRLTWTNPSPNTATGLRIFRSTNPTTGFTQVALVGRNSTSYTDSGLAPATQYYYRIVATNQVGDSPASNTAAVATRIAAPQLGVANLTHAEVDLSWTRTGNDHYLLERSYNGGAFMTLADNIPSTTTSYIDTAVNPPGTFTYRVTAFNTNPNDSAVSNVVSVTNVPVVIDHSAGFASHSDLTINGNAFTGGTAGGNLRLTTNLSETGSAFTNQRVNVDRFTTTFTFRIHDGTNPPADGFTFTIQNNAPTALGAGGGCLGYCNIGNSVAVMFDMYTGGTLASTTNLLFNGVKAGAIDMGPSGIDLKNANVKQVDLNYDGTTLHEVVTDTVTHAVFTHDYTVNIASSLNSTTAFVGFTGATGGLSALQDIQTWFFNPGAGIPGAPVGATAVVNGANVNLSWLSRSVNETGFSVERSDNNPNNFRVIGTATGPRFTDTNVPPGNHYYRVRAFNAQGNSAYSNTVNVVIGPTSPFTDHSGGFTTTTDLKLNGGAAVVGTRLRLTDGGGNEARTAWTTAKVGVQSFSTSFVLQDQNVTGSADGVVFAVQNNDPNQVGGAGGAFGYGGIGKSVAIYFDLYSNATHNSTTGILVNGTVDKTNAINMGPAGIVLGSNHPLRIDLAYDVTQLTFSETVTDTVTGASFQHTYTNVNIPQTVGGTTAYVGFGGATGGETAVQDIVSWSGRFLDPNQPVSQLGVSAASSVAGTPISVTVTARDAFGNAVKTGYTGRVHFTSSDPQAVLPADYTFTAADMGVHTFTGVILKTAGTQTITVMDTAMTYIVGSTSTTVTAAAASRLLVSYPAEVTAGTLQLFNVTAQDAYGNTAPTYRGTVHLTSSDPQALLSPDGTFTAGDNGTHQFSAVFFTAGMQTLTATDTQTGTIVGTETIKVDPAAAAGLAVSGFPSPTTAGVAQPVTVTARDRFGNTATGYRGTVRLTSSDPQADLPADYTFTTADNGVHTFTVTLKTAGMQSITATDTAVPALTGTQGGIVVAPAAASALQVSGFPSPATAGAPGAVVVTAVDAYGNVATGYTGTVHLSSSDPQAVLEADHTFTAADNGRHAFGAVLFTAGTQSITATDTADPDITGTQDGIEVVAAAAATLVMSSFPSPTTAGDSAAVTVTLYDAYGNVATGYAGTVSFFSSDPQADLPADYAFTPADQGSHTFTIALKTAGTQSLGAFDVNNPALASEQDGIEVDPAAASALVVAGFPSPVVAGTPGEFTITVTDAYGNTVTGYTGTVALFSSDPQADLPGNYTFTPDDQGSHTFTATLFTAGTQAIGAVDVRDGSIAGEQDGIQVLPAAASSLRVSGFPSPTTAGTPGRFAVTAFDPYGNVATGYTGTVHFTSSDDQAELPDDYTFTESDGGFHFFMATLNTEGTQSLTATDVDTGISGTQAGITVLAGGVPGTGQGSRAEVGLAAALGRAGDAPSAAAVARPSTAVAPAPHAQTVSGDDSRTTDATPRMTVPPSRLDLVLADWDAGLVHGLLMDDLIEAGLLGVS